MTPAVHLAKRARVPFEVHEYRHDPAAASYGEEAVRALGVSAERVFKTLVVSLEPQGHAVAVVPMAGSLDLKALATALGAKRAVLAEPREAERLTGYLLGAISPLGQKRRLDTVVDESALQRQTIFVSAGRRGLELELAPAVLVELCGAGTAAIARGAAN
jgi:Cys-tRNA(Pro)/Cys-tRNA(Cys) deacylase